MAQPKVRALDGRESDHRHLLRVDRALPLRAVVPAVLSVSLAAVAEPAHPAHRIAMVAGVLAALAVAWGPFEGTGRIPLLGALVSAMGVCLAPVACALVFGTSPIEAAAAGLVIAGFLLLLAGLAAVLSALFKSAAAGMILAGTAGALAIASFHVGDPFLEWGGSGVPSKAAIAVLHAVNPLCGAVGDGLGIDWLRLPIMYSGFPGALTGGLSTAQYYDWSYPDFWIQATAFGLPGLLLLVLSFWVSANRGRGLRYYA